MAIPSGLSGVLPAANRPAASAAVPSVAEVVREHAPFVGRSLRYLGVRDAELEDAAQEVFLVVCRRLGDFEGRSSLRTWLYGICLRTAQSYRRRAASRREQLAAEPPEAHVQGEQDAALHRAQARRRLQRVLAELDEAKRTVFVLYELEQLSMKEVAEAVGCPLQTAYSRHQAGRQQVLAAFERLQREEAQ